MSLESASVGAEDYKFKNENEETGGIELEVRLPDCCSPPHLCLRLEATLASITQHNCRRSKGIVSVPGYDLEEEEGGLEKSEMLYRWSTLLTSDSVAVDMIFRLLFFVLGKMFFI